MSKNIKEYVISEIGKQFSREYEDMWVAVQIWHGDGDKIYFRFSKTKEGIIKELENWIIQCREIVEDMIIERKWKPNSVHMYDNIISDGKHNFWWEAYIIDDIYGSIVSLEATRIIFEQ